MPLVSNLDPANPFNPPPLEETEAFLALQSLRSPAAPEPAKLAAREKLSTYVTQRRAAAPDAPLFPTIASQAERKRTEQIRDLVTKPLADVLPTETYAALEARAATSADPDAFRARQVVKSVLQLQLGTKLPPAKYDFLRSALARELGTENTDLAVRASLEQRYKDHELATDALQRFAQDMTGKILTGDNAGAAELSRATLEAMPEHLREAAMEEIFAARREARDLKRRTAGKARSLARYIGRLNFRGEEADAAGAEAGDNAAADPVIIQEAVDLIRGLNPDERAATLTQAASIAEGLYSTDSTAKTAGENVRARLASMFASAAEFAGQAANTTAEAIGLPQDFDRQARSDARSQIFGAAQAVPSYAPGDSWYQKAFLAGAGQLPTMAAVFGGPAGLTFLGASMAGQSYQAQRVADPDGNPNAQLATAGASGFVQMGAEVFLTRAGMHFLRGKSPTIAGILSKTGIRSKYLRAPIGGLANAGSAYATEYSEEIIQGAVDALAHDAARELSGIAPRTDWGQFFKDWIPGQSRQSEETLYALLPYALIGAGVAGSYQHFKHGDFLQRSRPMLRAIGLPDTVIDAIQKADPVEAAELTRQAFETELQVRTTAEKAEALEFFRESAATWSAAGLPIVDSITNGFTEETTWFFQRDPFDPSTRVEFETEEQALTAWAEATQDIEADALDALTVSAREDALALTMGEGTALEGKSDAIPLQGNAPSLADAARVKDFRGQPLITPDQIQARLKAFLLQGGSQKDVPDLRVKARRHAERLRNGMTRQIVQYFQDTDPVAILEDSAEAFLDQSIADGFLTASEILPQIRRAEQATGKTYLAADYTADNFEAGNTMPLLEAFSAMVRDYAFAEIRSAAIPDSLRAWVSTHAIVTGHQFAYAQELARAPKLAAAIREGRIDAKFRDLLADAIGIDTRAREARMREAYQAQLAAEAMEGFPEISDSARRMLPHPQTLRDNGDPLAGEMQRIHDHFKKPVRRGGKTYMRTNEANEFFLPVGQTVKLDEVREALNDQGFDFDTPADMIAAIDASIGYGIKTYGTRSILDETGEASFSFGRATVTITPAENTAFLAAVEAGDVKTALDIAQQVEPPMSAVQPQVGAFAREIGGKVGLGGWDSSRGMSRNAARAEDEGRMQDPDFRAYLSEELGLKTLPTAALQAANTAAGNAFREYHHVGAKRQEVDFYDPAKIAASPRFWLGLADHLNAKTGGKKAVAAALEKARAAWQTMQNEEPETRSSLGDLRREMERQQELERLPKSIDKRRAQIAKWEPRIRAGEKPPFDRYLEIQKEELAKEEARLADLQKESPTRTAEAVDMTKVRETVPGSESRQSGASSSPQSLLGTVTLSTPSFALSPASVNRLEAAIAKKMAQGPMERADYYTRLRDRLAGVLIRYKEFALGPDANALDVQMREAREALAEVSTIVEALPLEVRGRVRVPTNDILDAKSQRGRVSAMLRLIDEADAALEKHLKTEYTEALGKLLDLAKPDLNPATRQARGRLTPLVQDEVSKLIELIQLTPVEAGIRQHNADVALANAETTLHQTSMDDPDALQAAQDAYIAARVEKHRADTFGSVLTGTAADIAAAHDELLALYKQGRFQRNIIDDARRQEIAAARGDILRHMKEVTQSIHRKATEKQSIGALLDSFRLGHYSFHQVMESHFPGSAVAADHQARARKADAGYRRAIIDSRKRWENWARSTFNLPMKSWRFKLQKILADLSAPRDMNIELREGVSFETVKLDEEQAVAILGGKMKVGWENDRIAMDSLRQALMEFRMLKSYRDSFKLAKEQATAAERKKMGRVITLPQKIRFQRLVSRGTPSFYRASDLEAAYILQLSAQKEYEATLDAYGFTKDVLKQIEETIDERALWISEYLQGEYAAEYDRLNPVFQRLFGFSMPRIRNYTPARFHHANDTAILDPEAGDAKPVNALSAGFTKSRVNHMARPKGKNALALYWEHISATEYFIHWAELIRDMRAVYLDPKVRFAIEGNFGIKAASDFYLWLDTLAADGRIQSRGIAADAEMTSNMQAALAASGLAWNFGSVLKQIPAAMNGFLEMPVKDLMNGFRIALKNPDVWKKVWDSDTIQQRIEGGISPEDARILQAAASKPSVILESFRMGRLPLAYGDAMATSLYAASVYAGSRARALDAGVSPAEAETLAMEHMDRVVKRTAQPATTQDRSLAELTSSRIGMMIGYMFRSDPRQKAAISIKAAEDLRAGRITKREFARRILFSWIIPGIIIEYVSDFWLSARSDDDPERYHWRDYLAAALAGPISGLGWLGGGMEAVIRGTVGTDFFSNKSFAATAGDLFANYRGSRVVSTLVFEAGYDDLGEFLQDILGDARDYGTMLSPFSEKAAGVAVGARIIRDVHGVIDNLTESDEERQDSILTKYRAAQKSQREETRRQRETLSPSPVLSAQEKALRSLSPENRAQAIREIIAPYTPAQRTAYLARLTDLGILTESTRTYLDNAN